MDTPYMAGARGRQVRPMFVFASSAISLCFAESQCTNAKPALRQSNRVWLSSSPDSVACSGTSRSELWRVVAYEAVTTPSLTAEKQFFAACDLRSLLLLLEYMTDA